MQQSESRPDAMLFRRSQPLVVSLRSFLAAYQAACTLPATGAVKASTAAAATSAKSSSGGKAGAATGKQARTGKADAPAAAGKGKAAKDPKTEAWAKLMGELDERINKAKRCQLEDLYCAIGALGAGEAQALACAIAASGPRVLPDKALNEAAMAIRSCLFAAAAAHTFRVEQHPEASKCGAAAYRERGLPADCALEAGFRVGQLLRGGYTPAELTQSAATDARHLRAAGIPDPSPPPPPPCASSFEEFRAAARPLMRMRPGGADLPHLMPGTARDKLAPAGRAPPEPEEPPAAAVLLAAHPVRGLAQRRQTHGAAPAAAQGSSRMLRSSTAADEPLR